MADLHQADLSWARLGGADLRGARLGRAVLHKTVLAEVNLVQVADLDTCRHFGPSTIDHQTLERSGPLPLIFLRGVGLPETPIEYLPSLLNQSFEFYSCFISYSAKDQELAERLHADLQNKGVRCWFAPHDRSIGANIWDFTRWKDHDSYQKTFERVLRDLTIAQRAEQK